MKGRGLTVADRQGDSAGGEGEHSSSAAGSGFQGNQTTAHQALASIATAPASAHPAAGSDSWCTPSWLAEALGSFAIDPCSNDRSHIQAKCTFTGAGDHDDGLTCPWGRASVFCNPPYSDVGPWARKLAAHPGPWCALVKLDPTTKWWATLMSAMPTVAPFRKRIKFEGNLSMTANFASVLVYSAWRPPAALVSHLWLPTYAQLATQRTAP